MQEHSDSSLSKKQLGTEVLSLEAIFEAYCRMDPLSVAMNVNLLPLSQLNKWLTSAGLLDVTRITATEAGLLFFKFRKRAISYQEFLVYLKDLAATKFNEIDDIKRMMETCGKLDDTKLQEDNKK